MEEKKKTIVMVALVAVLVLAGVWVIATRPAPVPSVTIIPEAKSPVMRVVVNRSCDFVTISNMITVLCTDGTEWKVTEVIAEKPNLLGLGAQQVNAAESEETPIPRDDSPAISAETVETVLAESDTGYINMNIRYSHYWPPLGGPNCSNFVAGKCISNMASGKPWADYVDLAVACPPEWPFGRQVIFEGNTYTCLDRGGKIKYVEGIPWIDFLTPKAAYPYGSIITVQVSK